MRELVELTRQLWVQIIGGILLLAILSIYAILRKKINEKFAFYSSPKRKAKKYLKELRKSKREHIVPRYLMYLVAKQTGIHLFGAEGEDVSLLEYGQILYGSIESLTGILKKIDLIELTSPSIWYHKQGESRERAHITEIARKYLELQKDIKKKKGDKVTIRRYLVLSKEELESDLKAKEEFINEHVENNIELYFCPSNRVRRDIRDTAIFIDEKEKGWAITSLNFDNQTLQNPSNWIRVRIEDSQEQINNFYQTLIIELQMCAIKLAPK